MACIDIAPFEIDYIRQADVVVAGKLVGYVRIPRDPSLHIVGHSILTVRVDSVLAGRSPRVMRLSWTNSTFNTPEKLTIGEKVIAAGVSSNYPRLELPEANAANPAQRRKMMSVLQASCAPAFILPYSPESEANLRAILRGEPVKPFDYRAGSERLYRANQWSARLLDQLLTPLLWIVGAAGLAGAISIVFQMRRRRV